LSAADRDERARHIRKRLGVRPMVLGGAVLAGARELSVPLLQRAPGLLLELLSSGKPLDPSTWGKPVDELSEFSRQELKAIRGFAEAEGVHVPMVSGPMTMYMPPPRFDFGTLKDVVPHIAVSRTSVPQAMHEIGHASKRHLVPALDLLAHAGRSWPGTLARGAIGIAALTASRDDQPDGFVARHAPALMAATYAPGILEEARATANALRGARRFGPGVGAAAKELVPAFATYVGEAGGSVLATVLAQRLMKYLFAPRGDAEKRASEPKMSGALRAPASAAWHMGGYPKPKTTPPGPAGQAARGMPAAKPPSNRAFHQDMTKSLADPARGARAGVPTS